MTEAARGEALRERAEAAGQGHLFAFWERLDPAQRERLVAAVEDLDFGRVEELRAVLESPPAPAADRFEPPELFPLERGEEHVAPERAAREKGAAVLAAGRVGYVVVAGGQGSRLGFDGPKGTFELGPVSDRTLFGWHAARLSAAGARHGAAPTWYVMTSRANHADTLAHFEERGWYGLDPGDVFVFRQRMLPALDPRGRILMAAPDAPFLAPNGHGGTLDALRSSGALEHAAARGIDTFSYFQVDNPLSRPADPLFVGLHAAAGAEMSSKVVAKRDAGEKVGVIGRADGRLGCIEYSDLPDELRHATDLDGALLFRAGNIACHLIERAFVERLTAGGGLDLPWHLARKDVDSIDEKGRPTRREGIKFETFVFDALGEARASVTLECDRAEEFAPVKNADGLDSPATSRAALSALARGWIESAGGTAPERVEVDPRVAEDARELSARWPLTPRVLDGGHLYEP